MLVVSIFVLLFVASAHAAWPSFLSPLWGSDSKPGNASNQNTNQIPPVKDPAPKSNTRMKSNVTVAPISIVHNSKVRFQNSTTVPTKHSFDEVLVRRMKEAIKRLGSVTKLIFVGDSIVYKWSKNATLWSAFDDKYAALNLGCPGDKTENLLHRFYHQGLYLSNITTNPYVVVMIGSSNVLIGDTSTATFTGIVTAVDALRAKLPNSPTFVYSLLPRKQATARATVAEINSKLQEHYQNISSVTFIDSAKYFVDSNGTLKTNLFMPDFFYPNGRGFQILTDLLIPYLADLTPANKTAIPQIVKQQVKTPLQRSPRNETSGLVRTHPAKSPPKPKALGSKVGAGAGPSTKKPIPGRASGTVTGGSGVDAPASVFGDSKSGEKKGTVSGPGAKSGARRAAIKVSKDAKASDATTTA